MGTLSRPRHFQPENKQSPGTAASFTAFLSTPQGSCSIARVSCDTGIFARKIHTTAEKPPDWADCMKIQLRDPGKDWLTGRPIIMSQVKQHRRRVTHYKHN